MNNSVSAQLIIAQQKIDCQLDLVCHIGNLWYEGRYLTDIQNNMAIEFWTNFESAVNECLLSHLDELQKELHTLPFYVVLFERTFRASEIDLQIYPSTMSVAFRPQMPNPLALQ